MWLQEERNAKGELKQLLALTVQSERAAETKLAGVSAELVAVKARLEKAEAALQVAITLLSLPLRRSEVLWQSCCRGARMLRQAPCPGV